MGRSVFRSHFLFSFGVLTQYAAQVIDDRDQSNDNQPRRCTTREPSTTSTNRAERNE